jgi:cytochrome c biogenesis protein CcdA|tara:strand:- start:47 stop:799 length:753 start_codon:yes stop_codon:yes gene_type:complete
MTFSSSSSNSITTVLDLIPLSFSFGAGALTAVNPCGFAMLPIYLSMYLKRSGEKKINFITKFNNSILIITTIGMGFLVLFLTFGFLIGLGGELLSLLIPTISIFLGIIVLYMGFTQLIGEQSYIPFFQQLASKIGNPNNTDLKSFFIFGISYGIASIGCSLPLFIALITNSIKSQDLVLSIFHFLSYALGMIFIVGLVTVFISIFSKLQIPFLNQISRKSSTISGITLCIVGIYLLIYWLTDLKFQGNLI